MNPTLSNKQLLLDESLLSTANGYIGMRANFEEGYPSDYTTIRGTYINGFYEEYDLCYGENAVGFPQTAQKIVNIVDAQGIEIIIDDDIFSLFTGTTHHIHREIDIRKGFAIRSIDWTSPKGHHLQIEVRRMTSFHQLELATIEYRITSINYSGTIEIRSTLRGDVENYTNPHDMRVASGHSRLLNPAQIQASVNHGFICAKTQRSDLTVAAHYTHSLPMVYEQDTSQITARTQLQITPRNTLSFTKYIVYTDNLRHADCVHSGANIMDHVHGLGIDYYYQRQIEYLDDFWQYAYIRIDGDTNVEKALNYSTYQLLSSAGKTAFSNISAKGLSGEGYEGHYFWDTEIYLIPLFTLTRPDIAKNLLRYRYDTLNASRKRSLEMGHKHGAKIAWRTISGHECSPYFPAGSAQYHINADVAYANIQYYLYTKDIDMLLEFGFEVIFETARIWLEIGHYNHEGKFCIDAVTGPDEYTAIVNNNYYTNAMAQYHLHWANKLALFLAYTHPKEYYILADKLDILAAELRHMDDAQKRMHLPYDSNQNIHLQDDHAFNRKVWDFEATPDDHYPLLLHYHPLTIYRHQVLKQADTILAHMLLDCSDDEVVRNSFHHYERLTTHDSSLSPCVHSIMANRIGDTEKAYDYFMQTIYLDIHNLNKNTADGLHIANAGGAYMAIVYGFGGLRIQEDGLHLNPHKTLHWAGITFQIRYQEAMVTVQIREQIHISSTLTVPIVVFGESYSVSNEIVISYPE